MLLRVYIKIYLYIVFVTGEKMKLIYESDAYASYNEVVRIFIMYLYIYSY